LLRERSAQAALGLLRRDVVERRVFTVTGKMPAEEDVEQLIETGESETIFQKAILEQGRGQARCLTQRRSLIGRRPSIRACIMAASTVARKALDAIHPVRCVLPDRRLNSAARPSWRRPQVRVSHKGVS